jgi:outer membrane protein
MKKLSVWAIALMGLAITLPSMAASQAPKEAAAKKEMSIKLGIIDTAKIMRESKAAKNAQAIFLKDLEAKSGILAAKEKEVRLLEEELKNPDTKLSPEERNSKTDKISKDIKELNRLKSDLEEELKKKDVELTRKLIGEIREIVNAFSKKENYTLILEKNAVVVSDNAIDITDKIIQLYDGLKR